MEIYIYKSEKSDLLKSLCPNTIVCKIITDFLELYKNEKFDISCKKMILCIDETQKIQLLGSHSEGLLVVNSEFLIQMWKKYEKIFLEINLFHILDNVIILFKGFNNEESLRELEFKVIIMGGGVLTKYTKESNIFTHVIPYKMNRSELKEILEDSPFRVSCYTSSWIEYIWGCSPNYPYEHDVSLKNSFEPKCFMNCKINLTGFNNIAYSEIGKMVINNGGALCSLRNIDLIDFVIVPNEFIELDDYTLHLESIPEKIFQKVVYFRWLLESLNVNYLVPSVDYQVFADKDGDWEIADECQEDPRDQIGDLQKSKIINPELSALGFDPQNYSKEQISEKVSRRSFLLKEYVKFIKNKVEILNNFQELKTKLSEDVNFSLMFKIFHQIFEFFNILCNILEPWINHYVSDYCFFFESLSHFYKLKNYFISYNSKFDEIIKIVDGIEKENIMTRDHLNRFASENNVTMNYFVQLPKRILTDSEVQLKDILRVTSKRHPDFVFLIEVISINISVTNLLNKTEDQFIEAQNQLLIIKCIENPTIFREGNRYRSVIDCMQFHEDGLTCPKSLFIFDKTLVICKFKVPYTATKRYQKLIDKISSFNESISRSDELSRWSSRQSLYTVDFRSSPTRSFRSVSRNSSMKSVISSTCVTKKRLVEGVQSAKFHKLFTGLSQLNWSEKPQNIYNISEIIDKPNITSVTSNVSDSTIAGQLFFTINYVNKSGRNKSMKLQLCPRVMRDLSKYKQIKIALPGQFEWGDVNLGSNVKWDEFILQEKRNFCLLLANHYDTELFEDEFSHILPNCSDAENNVDDLFKTPFRKKNKAYLSDRSINQISSPSVKNNVFSNGLRRLTKILKIGHSSSNNFDNQSSFFEQEEEPTVLFNVESSQNSETNSPVDYISRRIKKRKSNVCLDHGKKNIKY